MTKLLDKTRGLQIYLLITIPAFLISQTITNVVVVRPRVQLSQVSAISAMQIWYWVLVILSIFIFIWAKNRFKIKKDKLIEYILYFAIFLNITFVAAANNLALRRVPLPPGDIRGDNGVLLLLMMKAQKAGWSGDSYPPVWVSLVGNIARFTGNSVLDIWKPVYLLSVVIFPGLVLLAWRQAFNPVAAAAATFLFTFGTIEWKGIALLIMMAMLIAISYRVVFGEKNKFQFDIKIFILGIFFGLSSLTYYGHLWWSLIAIVVLVISILFLKNRELLLINIFDAGLGFLLIFAPSQVGPRFGLSGLTTFLIIAASMLFRILSQKLNYLNHVLSYLTAMAVAVGGVVIVSTSRTGDTWMVDLSEQSPAPNLGLGFNTSGIFFTLVITLGLILAFKEQRYKTAIFVSITSFISAALMMFWFAAQMEVTDMVELWPRAAGTFGFAWTLLTLIAIVAILTSQNMETIIKTIWPSNLPRIQSIFLSLILIFPFVVIHARTLSESQDGIFPIGENAVWQAYRACDNPHEDPMLAKVFEERPFIQKYLRENCPKVDWPVIPAVNWVPVYPGTYAN